MNQLITILSKIFPSSYFVNEGDAIGVLLLLSMVVLTAIFMYLTSIEKEDESTILTKDLGQEEKKKNPLREQFSGLN